MDFFVYGCFKEKCHSFESQLLTISDISQKSLRGVSVSKDGILLIKNLGPFSGKLCVLLVM